MHRAHILIFLFAIACSSPSETAHESNFYPSHLKSYHFSPQHGEKNEPVSLVKHKQEYELYYKTGSDEWGIAKSQNLIDWSASGSVSMPENVEGKVVIDQLNTSELANDTNHPTVIVYAHKGEVRLKYSTDKQVWTEHPHSVLSLEGYLNDVFWHDELASWILLEVTEKLTVAFYSSQNLRQWTKTGSGELLDGAESVQVARVDSSYVLFQQTALGQLHYTLGAFTSVGFKPTSSPQKAPYKSQTSTATLYFDNELALLANMATGNTFAAPKQLRLENESLRVFPVENFKVKFKSKRRGRLSKLQAAGPCWFNFQMQDPAQFEVQIKGDKSEVLRLSWENLTNKLIISNPDEASPTQQLVQDVYLSTERLEVDILMDLPVVEIFLNEGEFAIELVSHPDSTFNQVSVKVDGASSDLPGSLYDL